MIRSVLQSSVLVMRGAGLVDEFLMSRWQAIETQLYEISLYHVELISWISSSVAGSLRTSASKPV